MKSTIPPYLIFFSTSRCNMRCKHCFYWDKLDNVADELTLEEIGKIACSLKGLFFLRVTGGEPFVREDLPDIIKTFYKNSRVRRIGLSTNGFLTERIERAIRSIVEELKDLNLEIGISIDGMPHSHDEIRSCSGAYEHAMHTYSKLTKIRESAGNLKVGFLVTIMKDNQDELGELFGILSEKDPDAISCNLIRGRVHDPLESNVDIEKYDKFQKILDAYNLKQSAGRGIMQSLRLAKASLSHQYIMKTFQSGMQQLDCLAGEKIAVLYSNGDVNACELLDSAIGNARNFDLDFKKLWRSGKREEIIKKIKSVQCFCTHECFITANMIFSPKEQLKILSRWALNNARQFLT